MEVTGKMKKKIVKLTENDLERIVKRVINEDFATKLVSRGSGFLSKLKALGKENRDTRQYLNGLNRLSTSANQAEYILKDIQKDLNDLFTERFLSKIENINSKVINKEELQKDIQDFMLMLNKYKSAINKVVELNDKIKSLGKIETGTPTTNIPPSDEIAV